MNNIDQIVTDLSLRLDEIPQSEVETRKSIIKSAIEKAYDQGYAHGAQDQRKGDAASPATASELKIYDETDAKANLPPEANQQPDSASVGKDKALRDAVDALRSLPIDCLGQGTDGQLTWPIRDELISNLCKTLAATPSGGERWTEDGDYGVRLPDGTLFICRDHMSRNKAIESHNATLPRDCGQDTKRLDWLCAHLTEDVLHQLPDRLSSAREFIDNTMKSQP